MLGSCIHRRSPGVTGDFCSVFGEQLGGPLRGLIHNVKVISLTDRINGEPTCRHDINVGTGCLAVGGNKMFHFRHMTDRFSHFSTRKHVQHSKIGVEARCQITRYDQSPLGMFGTIDCYENFAEQFDPPRVYVCEN